VTIVALIVAAGRGSRAAAAGEPPKQYAMLGGRTVLARSIAAFADHPAIAHVQVVIHPDDATLYDAATRPAGPKLLPPVAGDTTRQGSVRNGLDALAAHKPTRVLIHDAARPFVTADVIDRVIAALDHHPGAIAAIPESDTLKRVGADGTISGTQDRTGLWRAQTPQGFRSDAIREAHARAAAAGRTDFTDDAAIMEWAGAAVAIVEGGQRNVKITTPQDIAMAQRLIGGADRAQRMATGTETRIGTGFDVHRFAPGSSVWLCGIEIPHTARLEGHSDADVGLHALTDAILGAIGAGDIGQHFPPSDMRWKNAASSIFLSHAAALVDKAGGRIVNVDVTVLAEAPRVAPHRAAMCTRIAEILRIDAARVSVKATTTEGLGFTGRREGIAAMATANIALPAPSSTDDPQRAS
jgi:2-C-methyl-D-erythritol 4-phosphate cytidylyltransferase/2-C-methyl-D-erythritol 2,4-cyclodiphosphate synthase